MDVASGLNIAAFNVGIALGSVVGGFVVEHRPDAHPWIGALIVLLTYGLTRCQRSGRAPRRPCLTPCKQGRHPCVGLFMGKMGGLLDPHRRPSASSQSRLTSPEQGEPQPQQIQVKYHISR